MHLKGKKGTKKHHFKSLKIYGENKKNSLRNYANKKDDVSFKSKSEADNSSLGETSPTNSIGQYNGIVNR